MAKKLILGLVCGISAWLVPIASHNSFVARAALGLLVATGLTACISFLVLTSEVVGKEKALALWVRAHPFTGGFIAGVCGGVYIGISFLMSQ